MRLRLIATAALIVVLVPALAVLLLDDGQVGVDAQPGASRVAEQPLAPRTVLPGVEPGAAQPSESFAGAPERLVVDAAAASADALLPQADARITGRVFDVAGAPVSGAPLVLLADDDRWLGRLRRRDELDLVADGRSDAEGRFVLAARAGVPQVLWAGGERHGRLVVEPVAAGDALELVLPAGLTVGGTVVDGGTGEPLAGAVVGSLTSSDRLRTESDTEGAFSLRPVPEGPLVVGAWLPGYDVGLLEDAAAGSDGLVLPLPPGRELDGVVIDSETRAPLAGAEVRLVVSVDARPLGDLAPQAGREDLWEQSTASGDDGGFLFSGAPSRLFRLEVRADGYAPAVLSRWESRVLGADERVVVVLQPERTISGVVWAGDSADPVAGARLSLACPDGELAAATSGIDGTFALAVGDWPGRGPLVVDAVHADGRVAREVVRRRDDGLELRLVEPLAIDLLVLEGGAPVPGAQVAVLSKDAEPGLGLTGADGLARVVHRLAGPDVTRVVVEARAGGRASLPAELDLTEGRPALPVVIDLDLGGRVAGTVVDPLGVPVSGALVTVSGGPFGRTGADGRFELSPVQPDAMVSLRATAEGHRPGEATSTPGATDALVVLEPVVRWSVRVVDGSTGLGLADAGGRLQAEGQGDAGVEFHDTKERLSRSAGEVGAFVVDLPDPGRFRLAVGAPDRIAFHGPAFDFDGVHPPPPLEVVLFRAAVLEVQLVDSVGRPVPGARVGVVAVPDGMADLPDKLLARGKPPRGVRESTTDGGGLVRFNLDDGGLFRLTNGSVGWLFDRPVAVGPGLATRQLVRIGGTGAIAVDVRDEGGQPVPDASVTVRADGRPRPFELRRKVRVPDQGGPAIVDVLPEALYRVQVTARGFASANEVVAVSPGGRAWVAVTMRPAGQSASKAPRDRRRGGR